MQDERQTREQLLAELEALRQRLTQMEQEQRHLKESQRILDALLEYIPEGIIVADACTMTIKMASKYGQRFSGRPRQALPGLLVDEDIKQWGIFQADGVTPVATEELPLTRATRNGEAVRDEEYVVQTPTGVRLTVLCNAGPIIDEHGKISGGMIAWQDITARKAAEAEIQRLASFPRLNPSPVLEADATGAVTFYNQAALTALTSLGEAAGPEAFFPDDLEDILTAAREQGERRFYREVRIKDAVFAEDIYYAEPLEVVRIYARDITARKQAEEALMAIKEEWELTFNAVPDLIAILDNRYLIVRVNRAMAEALGTSAQDLKGRPCHQVMHNSSAPPAFCPHSQLLADGREHKAEIRGLGRDFLVSASPLTDSQGNLIGSVHVARDITERKQVEEALHRSNQRLELLAETASQLLASVSPQQAVDSLCLKVMKFLDCDTFFNFLVDEPEGRLHLNAYAGIPAAEAKRIEWLDYGVAVCGCAARDRCRIVTENIQTTPDPRTELVKSYGIQAYACHPLIIRGRVLGTLSFGTRTRSCFASDELALMKAVADLVAIAMDRKLAEEALRASEKRERARAAELQAVLDAVPTPIFLGHNAAGGYITGNPAAYEMLRLPPGSNVSKAVPEGEKPCYKAMQGGRELTLQELPVQRATAGQMVRDFEYDLVLADGTVRHVSANAVPLLDEIGRPRGAVAAFMDLTERKAGEEALRRAHDELEQRVQERTAQLRQQAELLDLAHDAIIARDLEGRVVFWSRGAAETYGWTREQVLGRVVHDLLQTKFPITREEIEREVLQQGRWEGELKHIRADGTATIVASRWALQRDAAGEPTAFLEINRDITDRKAVEEALAQHAALVQDLYNHAPCGYHSLDPEGTVVQINDTELAWLGYTRDEVVGRMNFADLLTADSLEIFQQGFPRFKGTGWARDLEFQMVRKDGTIMPVLLSATAITDEAGNYLMSRSTVYDLTARKQAEEALQAERQRLYAVLERIPAYVALISPNCVIIYANREFIRRFGDPGNRLCYEFLLGLDAPCEGCKAMEVFKNHTQMTWVWAGPDGHTYQVYDYPFNDIDGSPLVLKMGVDISDLKAAESQMRRQSAILEGINRVLREALTCETEEELGRTCLAVAEELTGSKFGFIHELNAAGNLDTLAFSDPGWDLCQLRHAKDLSQQNDLKPVGLLARVVKTEKSAITYDPTLHLDAERTPEYQPPLAAFLGVPLKYAGKTIGLIGLANKDGGYEPDDQEAIETLAVAIVEALMRFRAEKQAIDLGRLYRLLSKVNEAIVRAPDQETLFRQSCRVAVSEGLFRMAWIGLIDPVSQSVKGVAQYGFEDGYLETLMIPLADLPESRGPTGVAIREGRYDICNDIASDPRMAPWRVRALERGYRASAAFPLWVGSKIVGALTLYAEKPGFFTADEIGLLEALAGDLSFALDSMDRGAKRRQAEEALRESEERLRALTFQLINAQEEERKRVSLELHDDLGQSLMVLKMQLRAIAKLGPPGQQKEIREHCDKILDYVNEIIENVRRLARDLRPSLLEDLGLPAALRHLVETFRTYHQIAVTLDMDEITGLFAPTAEVNIYRIFQESLTNIAKYSQATQVSCTIKKVGDQVAFRMEDNGSGFDLEKILARDAPRSSLGLTAMQERVRMLGGALEIWSREGQGTRISFVVPISS